MSRSKTVTKITEVITQVAPELQFVAAYNADDPQLAGSIKLYQKRCFIYVLTLQLNDREACIYVGKTGFQYARFLQHRGTFAFDRIYLYECEESVLSLCEAAVIRRLTPLFNKAKNPLSCRYRLVLNLDESKSGDRNAVVNYLTLWEQYCNFGLYGFALPPAIYRLLKAEALIHKKTVSEEMMAILEEAFAEDIAKEVKKKITKRGKTNLVTTEEYAKNHGKSCEQIKQYLHQEGRLTAKKCGRDWVIIDDEKFPEDRRKKDAIY